MRLDLSEADRNLVATLVAGERRGIDPKLRNDYAVTGVAHILSVSGLHMGFVLVIANLLLGWIVLFRRGHLIKNVLVILAMWSYAVVAGLSAPVVRAALMMSFAQLAGHFAARQRLQPRARRRHADARHTSGLPLRRQFPALIRRRAVDPVLLPAALPLSQTPG